MRIFTIATAPDGTTPALAESRRQLPDSLPSQGFVWISCTQQELENQLYDIQSALLKLAGNALVDLHVSDLLSRQLPSHYDYTSDYDVLVFRKLERGQDKLRPGAPASPDPTLPASASAPTPFWSKLRETGRSSRETQSSAANTAPLLAKIETSAIGFAVFDHVILTVHPEGCLVRDTYAARLLQATATHPQQTQQDTKPPTSTQTSAPPLLHAVVGGAGHNDARMHLRLLPASPADLMLRMVSSIVDGFLEMRRDLSQQLDRWQLALLDPATTFTDWRSLLSSRLSLHQLSEICEDQRAALQDWLDALEAWAETGAPHQKRERELLKVRSRDVLEHIERVAHHVHRMEQNAETAVQLHFSLQSNRANDIMRTLTVLTAVFLPLNLIAGIFGMNFDFLPLIHRTNGFWLAMGSMLFAAMLLTAWFWWRRYLNRRDVDS